MYDCMMALAERTHSIYAMTGKVTGRGPDKLVAPWGPFKCADGHVALMVPTEAMWKKFCTAIEHPELLEDARLQSGPDRAAHLDVLMPVITGWLADKTKEKATELFMAAGLPCAPVMSSEDCAKDAHTAARKMIVGISDPVMSVIKCIGSPFKMEEHEPAYGPLPALGDSTDEVLASLGYSKAEIQELHEKEVV
ncbi:MAG: CoA transferase, partial [Pyramidobacter sp.]|nr:CoA transferase [Pyramidobacter sp.]